MQNIKNIDPTPGDVVREKKDGLDYVIYTAGAIGMGLTLLSGISLLDKSIKQWTIENYSEDELQLIKKNFKNIDPQEIFNKVGKIYEDAAKAGRNMNQANFRNKLLGPEGKFIRDMLLIGDSITEYDSALVQLAKALNSGSPVVYRADDIYKVISNALDPEEFDSEFITEFARQFESELRLNAQPARLSTVMDSSNLASMLSPTSDGFNNSVIRKVMSFGNNKGLDSSQLSFLRRVISSDVTNLSVLDHIQGSFGKNKAEDNLTKLITLTLQKSGATNTNDETVKKFFNQVIKAAVKDPKKIPLELQQILNNDGFRSVVSEYDKVSSETNKLKYRSRRESTRFKQDKLAVARKSASIDEITSLIKKGGTHVSIERNTLLENYLVGGKVAYNGIKYDLSDPEQIRYIKNVMEESTNNKSLLLSTNDMKSLLQSRDIDLNKMLEDDLKLRAAIPTQASNNIGAAHMIGNVISNRSQPLVSFTVQGATDQKVPLSVLNDIENGSFSSFESNLPSTPKGKVRKYVGITDSGKYYTAASLNELENQVVQADAEFVDFKYLDVNPNETRLSQLIASETAQPLFQLDSVNSALESGTRLSTIQNYAKQKVLPNLRSTIVTNLAPVQGSLEGAYYSGQASARLALVGIKGINGSGGVRLIGTSVPTREGFTAILDRADRLLDPDRVYREYFDIAKEVRGKIGFFDLERNPTGSKRIMEISIVDSSELESLLPQVNEMRSSGKLITKSQARYELRNSVRGRFANSEGVSGLENRKTQLLNLIDELDNYDTIFTQSTNDYDFLLEEASLLKDKGLVDPDEYDSMIKRINYIRSNKAVTSETIAQLTGNSTLGNSSQGAQTAKHLGRKQLHTALLDNLDNYELMMNYSKDYTQIRDNLSFQGLVDSNVIINSRRLGKLSGDSIQVLSVRDLSDGNIQMEYKTSSGIRKIFVGSPDQIGAFFGESVTLSNYPTESTGKLRSDAVADLQKRMLRNLNSLTRTTDFPLDFNPKIPTGMSQEAFMLDVRRISNNISKLVLNTGKIDGLTQEELLDKSLAILTGNQADLKGIQQLLGADGLEVVDEAVLKSYQNAIAEEMTQQITHPVYKDSVEAMFESIGEKNLELITKVLRQPGAESFFQPLIASVIAEAPELSVHTDYFSYSLSAGKSGLRSNKKFYDPNISTKGTIYEFVNEVVMYGTRNSAADDDELAYQLLLRAGIDPDSINSSSFDSFRHDAKGFFESTLKSENLPDYLKSFSDDSINQLGRLQDKFVHQSPDIVKLMTQSLRDVLKDDDSIKMIEELESSLINIQRSYDPKTSARSVTDMMADELESMIDKFINTSPGNFDKLKHSYTERDISSVIGNSELMKSKLEMIRTITDTHVDLTDELFNAIKGDDTTLEGFQDVLNNLVEAAKSRSANVSPTITPPTPPIVNEIDLQKRVAAAMVQSTDQSIDLDATARAAREFTIPSEVRGAHSLMLIGAAFAFAGLFQPDIDSDYRAGNVSDMHRSQVGKIAEIPGDPKSTTVFTGQTSPFQLDISIHAFSDKQEKIQELISKVQESLSSHVDLTTTSRIKRKEEDQRPMIDHMRKHY